MKLSKQQERIFYQLNEKFNTCPDYFILNSDFLNKKYKHLLDHRYVIQTKLNTINKRVTVIFNKLRIFGYRKRKRGSCTFAGHSFDNIKRKYPFIFRRNGKGKKGRRSSSDEKISRTYSKTVKRQSETCVPRNINELVVIELDSSSNDDEKVNQRPLEIAEKNAASSPPGKINEPKVENANKMELDSSKEHCSSVASSDTEENEFDDLATKIGSEIPMPPEEVNKQLREQLKLLQMGKRNVSLFSNANSSTIKLLNAKKRVEPICCYSKSSSESLEIENSKTNNSKIDDNILAVSNFQTSTPIRTIDGGFNENRRITTNKRFIDSLIDKLRSKGLTIDSAKENEQSDQNLNQTAYVQPSTSQYLTSSLDINESSQKLEQRSRFIETDDDNSICSISSVVGFVGFGANDSISDKVSALLATPIVENRPNDQSAFHSEELDTFMKENSLENVANVMLPLKIMQDDALKCSDAVPPQLSCPELPNNIEKPRTVAEKRMLLAKKTDLKYLMIENESTVYRELRKRSRMGTLINHEIIQNIQENDIPFTRDCWRATNWLNTENGKFYFQIVRFNNSDVKIFGGRGNNKKKLLTDLPSKLINFNGNCTPACQPLGNIRINDLEEHPALHMGDKILKTVSPKKRLNVISGDPTKMKAAPMSRKYLYLPRTTLDIELGPLEIYNMPLVQLEVFPKLENPLPNIIRPYLKMALPFDNISSEWAAFAASSVVEKGRKRRKMRGKRIEPKESFMFDIPYCNYQHKVLVRKRKQNNKNDFLKTVFGSAEVPLNFTKNIDPNDHVQKEVADILTEMIHSVAISLSEDHFLKDDPNGTYDKQDEVLQKNAATKVIKTVSKCDFKQRIVRELKRLNMSVVSAFEPKVSEKCTQEFCKLGCVCDSLSISQPFSTHCSKVGCIFFCNCPKRPITLDLDYSLRNNDFKRIRDKAASMLAKEEKEFTSTVVISDNKTIIMPNSDQHNFGKRNKKVPKRYGDCLMNNQTQTTIKTGPPSSFDCSDEDINKNIEFIPKKETEIGSKIACTNSPLLDQMVHVTVNIENLEQLQQLEPWCMIHCLYKCFCKFKSTTGRPFDFANYQIEQLDSETSSDNAEKLLQTTSHSIGKKYSEQLNKIGKTVHNDIDEMTCARAKPVFADAIRLRNKKRYQKLRPKILQSERNQPQIQEFLNNRIKRCFELYDNEDKSVDKILIEKPTTMPTKSAGKTVSAQMTHVSTMEKSTKPASTSTISISSRLQYNEPIKMPNKSKLTADSAAGTANLQQKNVKILNFIVSKAMQSICHIQRTNNKKVAPPQNKVLTYVQWKCVCDAFLDDSIFVWSIQLETNEILLAITVQHIMPVVRRANCVINIKAVELDKLPLLARMLKLGISNKKTDHLAVLLSGVSNFWRVIGFIHSENEYLKTGVQVKPTPLSHPEASVKISSLFNILTQHQMKAREKKNSEVEQNKSNIPLLPLSEKLLFSISVPIPIVGSHRWFMLQVASDFSHIHIPSWNTFLSYDKICAALIYARTSKKTVKISHPGKKPDVYVVNNENDKIFFGPYQMDDVFDLKLLQYFNGKMMDLEEYEKINNKPSTSKRTTGCWLYMKNNYMLIKNNERVPDKNEMDNNDDVDDCLIVNTMNEIRKTSPLIAKSALNVSNSNSNIALETSSSIVSASPIEAGNDSKNVRKLNAENDDSDDDCVIIEPKEETNLKCSMSSDTSPAIPNNHTENTDCFAVETPTIRKRQVPRIKTVGPKRSSNQPNADSWLKSKLSSKSIPLPPMGTSVLNGLVTTPNTKGVSTEKKIQTTSPTSCHHPQQINAQTETKSADHSLLLKTDNSNQNSVCERLLPSVTLNENILNDGQGHLENLHEPLPFVIIKPLVPTRQPSPVSSTIETKTTRPVSITSIASEASISSLTSTNAALKFPPLPPLTPINKIRITTISSPLINSNAANKADGSSKPVSQLLENKSNMGLSASNGTPNMLNPAIQAVNILQSSLLATKRSDSITISTGPSLTGSLALARSESITISTGSLITTQTGQQPRIQQNTFTDKLKIKIPKKILKSGVTLNKINPADATTNTVQCVQFETPYKTNHSGKMTTTAEPTVFEKTNICSQPPDDSNIASKLVGATDTNAQMLPVVIPEKLDDNTKLTNTIDTPFLIPKCKTVLKRRLSNPIDLLSNETGISIKKPKIVRRRHSVMTVDTKKTNNLTTDSKSLNCTLSMSNLIDKLPNITFTKTNEEIAGMASLTGLENKTTTLSKTPKENETDTEVIVIDEDMDEESNSVLPSKSNVAKVKGFFLSNLKCLGKIPAERSVSGIRIKLENEEIQINKDSDVSLQINGVMRQKFYRIIPRNWNINWTFVAESSNHDDYEIDRIFRIKPSEALTTFGIVDLSSEEIELDTILPDRLKEYLLIWKLAHSCFKKRETASSNAINILEKSTELIKTLTAKEYKLDNLKMYYNIKIQLKKLKIQELTTEIEKSSKNSKKNNEKS